VVFGVPPAGRTAIIHRSQAVEKKPRDDVEQSAMVRAEDVNRDSVKTSLILWDLAAGLEISAASRGS
jgi:hypothetical protein